MNPAALLSGLQGIGNVASQATNIVQVLDQMRRNEQFRQNPALYNLTNSGLAQYNSMPTGGAYGDYSTVFGNVLGQNQDGSAIQPGQAQAAMLSQFMQSNPANAAMNTLNATNTMQRPSSGSFADMFGGSPSGGGQYQQTAMPQGQQPVPTPQAAPTAPSGQYQNPTPQAGGTIAPQAPDANGGLLQQIISRMQQQNQTPSTPSPQTQQPGAGQPQRNQQNVGQPGVGTPNRFGSLPSYAVGTPYVQKDQVAQIHQGEAIVPANQNPANPMNRYADIRQRLRGIQTPNAPVQTLAKPATTPSTATTAAPTQQTTNNTGTRIGSMIQSMTPQQQAEAQNTTRTAQPYSAPMTQPATGSSGTPVTTAVPAAATTAVNPAVQTQQAINQAAQPNTSINDGRTQLLQQLLANPTSFTPQVQQQIMQGLTGQADLNLQGQMRSINEDAAARGLSQSGIPIQSGMQAYDARNSNLMDAQRQLGSQAALQNFQDMGNTANLALNQQTQMGQNAMNYQQMQNNQFNEDRSYGINLANQQYQLGSAGRNDQLGYLTNLLNLSQGGQTNDQNQINWLTNLIQNQYRNVDANSQLQQFNTNYYQPQQSGGNNNSWLQGLMQLGGTLGGAAIMA